MSSSMRFGSLAVVAFAFAAGCGHTAVMPPVAADAESQISAAEAVGAQNEPKAALHLKMARDQVAAAQLKLKDGEDNEARMLLERAKVDAELALVLTREAHARAEAQQAMTRVQQLQQQAQ